MRKSMAVFIALAVLAAGGAAWAAGSNTLTVQASVGGTCKFSTLTSTLDFGALDPSSAANGTGSTTTNFWCTKGVSTDTISAGNGAHYTGTKNAMLDSVSGDVIPYTLALTKDGLGNNGPGFPRTLTIDGTVLNADYIGKTAGNYSDTVTLTINP